MLVDDIIGRCGKGEPRNYDASSQGCPEQPTIHCHLYSVSTGRLAALAAQALRYLRQPVHAGHHAHSSSVVYGASSPPPHRTHHHHAYVAVQATDVRSPFNAQPYISLLQR